ncbi:Hypothetical predicted protein [Podarcis lilfordi]|uniref:Uncharacterized protein n=1 Tax=Podarcis lilfordi TaxID=74358 RepID=A0AA35KZ81_9SAUR|nr:Hypothetical predicted protein [Podarcis lilfordi]
MWRGFPESRRIGKTPLWTAAARLKTDATMKMAIHPAAPEGEMKQQGTLHGLSWQKGQLKGFLPSTLWKDEFLV